MNKKQRKSEESISLEKQACIYCGNLNANLEPDNYNGDICGDWTPIWICEDCQKQRTEDI